MQSLQVSLELLRSHYRAARPIQSPDTIMRFALKVPGPIRPQAIDLIDKKRRAVPILPLPFALGANEKELSVPKYIKSAEEFEIDHEGLQKAIE
jgi:hypothetical protein